MNLSPGNPTYKLRDGFLTTQDDRVCLYAPRSTKAVAFWQGCEVISGHAFYQSRHLTRVQFLTDCRIREIGWGAFRFSGITELEVPRSVKTIGHDAFADCSQLTSLTFEAESELHTIGNSAFALTGIVQCHLPQSLRVLGHSAFACCPELRLVVLPAGVARVDRMTFYTCPKLSSVVSEARTKVTVAATALERADAAVVYTRPGVVVDGGDGLKVETPDSLEAVSRLVDYAQPERTKRHASSVSALAVKRDAYVRVEEAPIFRGTAATVYQMQDKATGKRLAGKQLVVGTDRALAQFMLEVETLFQLIHPMVLGIIGYVMPRANEAWIYTEWAENGSLKDQLLAGTLDATTKAKIMAGVVIGMRHIHECGVLHRDLKPGNVLLVRDFDVRIGDFGSAKNSDADSSMTTDVGSPMYQAPELGRTPAQYDHRVDMFSFGVMLWEVVTGKVPFSGRDGRTILTAVQTGKRPEEGLVGRPFPQGLIAACWDEEPSARPEFAEIFAIMKANDWAILPGVDSSEVAAYVQKTLKEAAAYPPSKIERDRWKLA